MVTYAPADVMLNKVVVAFLDDRRLRRRVYDFSPLKDTFRLVAESAVAQQIGVEVALKDLKAVFFVKDFKGNSRYKESKKVDEGKPGRKIEVTFSDGRKLWARRRLTIPPAKGFLYSPRMPRATVCGYSW
jgi:hypothetical protein